MDKIVKVWTTETEIWVEREDGVQAFERFEDYPRLRIDITSPTGF